jgi:hypothetical protein
MTSWTRKAGRDQAAQECRPPSLVFGGVDVQAVLISRDLAESVGVEPSDRVALRWAERGSSGGEGLGVPLRRSLAAWRLTAGNLPSC